MPIPFAQTASRNSSIYIRYEDNDDELKEYSISSGELDENEHELIEINNSEIIPRNKQSHPDDYNED